MGAEIPTVKPEDEGRPTIAFRTNSPRQKAKWERVVAESDEYDSLSHLIRRSVERELSGQYDTQAPSKAAESAVVGELTETVERVEHRLKGVSEAVERLEDHTFAEGGLSDETLQTVFGELPIGEGEAVSGENGTRPQDIAERTGLDQTTVDMALEQLRTDIGAVKREELPDGHYWFREA